MSLSSWLAAPTTQRPERGSDAQVFVARRCVARGRS